MSPCSDFYDRAIPVLNRVEVWNSEMLLLLFCFLLITAPAFCCLHPNFFEHVAELNSEWANVFLKMLRIKYRFVRLANHWILFSFTFHSVAIFFGQDRCGGVRDVPAPTDMHEHHVHVLCWSLQCVCVVQWFSPRSAQHSSLCPALIHLPTRYYRDAVEKNAESGLADRYARDLVWIIITKRRLSHSIVRLLHNDCKDSATKSTCQELGEKKKSITGKLFQPRWRAVFHFITFWPHRSAHRINTRNHTAVMLLCFPLGEKNQSTSCIKHKLSWYRCYLNSWVKTDFH